MKHCPHCDRDLPTADFSRNRSRRDGLAHWCRNCLNAKERASRTPCTTCGRLTAGERCGPCQRRQLIADRLEDIDWLLNQGESPWQVMARINMTPVALVAFCQRAGRRDLACIFESIARVAA